MHPPPPQNEILRYVGTSSEPVYYESGFRRRKKRLRARLICIFSRWLPPPLLTRGQRRHAIHTCLIFIWNGGPVL